MDCLSSSSQTHFKSRWSTTLIKKFSDKFKKQSESEVLGALVLLFDYTADDFELWMFSRSHEVK